MKKRNILFLLAVLLLSSFMILQFGCKKDKDEDPTPPTYTNGQGEIGSIGGTVMVDDASSPIDGASIVIPEGAIEETVNISIQQESTTNVAGHSNLITIQFLPEGLAFLKEVEITLPWSKTNQTAANTRAYYLDEDNSTIKQLEIKNVDTQNKLTTAYISHFSIFFSDPDELNHEIELVKTGNYFAGYFNLQTAFDQIPAIINNTRNADDIIDQEDGLQNCFVRLIFELHEKDGWFWSEVADMALYVSYDEWSGDWSIWIDKSNSSMGGNSAFQIFNKEGLTFNQITGTWMSGYPFLAIFDDDTYLNPDFSIDQENNYKMTCTWGIVKDYNGFLKPYVWTWQYNYCTEKQKWSEVSSFNGDANQNNIIDSYENGSGNQPPNLPTGESPDDEATNISTNTNLSWTCTDPDGDPLDYDIYFGTENPPPLEQNYHTSTSYDPGTLWESTTYYWYIKAFDDHDNSTEGQVWEFTTGSGGGNTPPTAIFTIDPSSGTTSTVFAFDASDSYDNEDPTSQLQVRWDFDGNGSWDTGWD
ncbi:MAG: hypothetical protein K8R41_03555, partial [Bacteroidales bacterium]|nr:hypothetical protein [Bacteroidales bacterium]